eukprot:GHVU01170975.1.p1 GENE.GHVU01170975.1~~GHVU01170975.1.p1  ORF type:complete len:313 (+),score=16.31 GHVU01170975.1:3-941(+)
MGKVCALHRVPAVTPNDLPKLCVSKEEGMPMLARSESRKGGLKAEAKVKTIKELALSLSHLRALSTAHTAGHEFALVLEDDASSLLLPYQPRSLRQLVSAADIEHPGWRLLHLSLSPALHLYTPEKMVDEYSDNGNPALVDLRRRGFGNDFWGTNGLLYSRRGMEVVLSKYFFPFAPRFRCWADNAGEAMIADHFLLELLDPIWPIPPVLMTSLSELSTGIRSRKRAAHDHYRKHQELHVREAMYAIFFYRPSRLSEALSNATRDVLSSFNFSYAPATVLESPTHASSVNHTKWEVSPRSPKGGHRGYAPAQ